MNLLRVHSEVFLAIIHCRDGGSLRDRPGPLRALARSSCEYSPITCGYKGLFKFAVQNGRMVDEPPTCPYIGVRPATAGLLGL